MYIPDSIKAYTKGSPYILDEVGMSGARILCFEDMILKIEPSGEESDHEYEMMLWLKDQLPVPDVLCREEKEGMNYLLMSRMSGEMACADKYYRGPEELLQWLTEHQPDEELIFSHGDFCLPNVFFEGGRVSGFIDLGNCGIADKYQDIALCYRSLKHNLNGKYGRKAVTGFRAERLFEELEIEPDWEKIRYFILLDELF